jgi:hypothetical protein
MVREERIMTRSAVLVTVVLAVLAGTAHAQSPVDGEVWRSGRIIEIAPDRSAIVLEELVTWTGPGTGVVTRSIRLTPRTSIRLIERGDVDETDTAMPGWDATPIDAGRLRVGDFVTVTTIDARRGVAADLQVVRPGAR